MACFRPTGRSALAALTGSCLLPIALSNSPAGWAAPGPWAIETVGAGGHSAALRLDSTGNPHVMHFGPAGLVYAHRDGTGWHGEVVLPGAVAPASCRSSIAIGASDEPHLAWWDGVNIVYAVRGPGGWSTEVVATAANPTSASIAVDPVTHGPRISYDSGPTHWVHWLYYAQRQPGGWQSTEVDANSAGFDNSLALDRAGVPHIAYISLSGVTYASLVPGLGTWDIQWVGGQFGFSQRTWLALDAGGRPHLSWYDSTDGIWYATGDGASWSLENVTTWLASGSDETAIALDPTGSPWILYVDLDSSQVTLAYRAGAAWGFAPVQAVGGSPAWPGIDIDASCTIHLGYRNDLSDTLEHAVANCLAGPGAGLRRNDEIRSLPPLNPDLATAISRLRASPPYCTLQGPGDPDPEAAVLGDAGRPLVLYELDGPAPVLQLTRSPAGRVLLWWR